MVVVAAVAGTGMIGALAGAGYAMYGMPDGAAAGRRADAPDVVLAAEAGDRRGVQLPGAAGGDPAAPGGSTGIPVAGAVATESAPDIATPASPGASAAPASPGASAAPAVPTRAAVPKPGTTVDATTGAKSAASTGTTSASTASAGPGKAATTPASGATAQYAQQVVDLVNAQRSQHGCGPLSAEPRLAAAARSHSEDMADRGYFSHASPEGEHADHRIEAAGYHWSSWGENIARGQKDPAAVMDAWMNSPGHRANILNCSFQQIGVGVRTGSGGPWWTQVFASPS